MTQKKLEKHIGDPYIAEEISKSKRPYLYAAIAQKESSYRPNAVGKVGELGLFQIRPDVHGAFPMGIQHQVAKCESILEPLIAKHGLAGGIRRYNGSGEAARRYSKHILRLAEQIRNSG